MKKSALFAVCFLFLNALFVAQEATPVFKDKGSYKKNFLEGNLNIGDMEYDVALKYFLYAYKYDSTTANVNFKVGFCYIKSNDSQKHLAEKYLEKAVTNVTKRYIDDDPTFKKAPIQAYFYLGQMYHLDGRLDEALKMYETYESYVNPKDKEEHRWIEHFKTQIQNAKRMLGAPLNVSMKNLGPKINSQYPEYSPVITADEQVLYYTTRRPTTTGGMRAEGDGNYYEDIVVSYKDKDGNWGEPATISPFINTNGNEATISLTPDGQTLIIYKDIGDGRSGDIYYSSFDGKDWTIPTRFGSNINTEYWETHACLSRDGQTLYFVSDRPGGLGGRDIYRCVKLPNGQWSLATNVGAPINTPYDEDGPFLGADGITFYFSSNGDKSMGGFDIMFSIIDENGKFSEPMSMGTPINTTDDDVFYVATPDNKHFYLSSSHEYINKNDVHDKSYGDKDLYVGSVDLIKENPLALFKGRFSPGPCDSLPDDLSIIVTSVSTGEVVGTYRPQRKTGTFSVIIPPGSKYHFSYQQNGNEISSEDVFVPADIAYEEIQKAIGLKPINTCPGAENMLGDTTKSPVALNVLVLNNKKDKKPIHNAVITLKTKGTPDFTTKSDEDGRRNAIALATEKSYELQATSNGKSGKAVVFNTIGVKGKKVYEKTIYVEKNPGDDTELNLALTILNNRKNQQPVANANVTIVGTDGSTVTGTTNEKGILNNVALNPDVNYEVNIEKDGVTKSAVVSTQGFKKSRTVNKTVYLKGGASEVPDNSVLEGDCFTFYFKYNMNEVDETAPNYKKFVEIITAFKNGGGKVTIDVNASASTVPTHKYTSNKELAQTRANESIFKLKNSLKKNGITEITTGTNEASVNGPAYNHDRNNTELYEKYQYVKICLKR
ncbi:MAG: PD40 domain-containing protein [Bacteroidetes bacterium]|nr:PD40 domain-containing protein [Bacteroidota bacterium]